GSLQAMEAIKIILNCGNPPLGRLIHYDALSTRFREFNLRRDPECPLCGNNPSITRLVDYDHSCTDAHPNNDKMMQQPNEINVEQLKNKLEKSFDGLLIDVREQWEHDVVNIPSAKHVPMGEIPEFITELKNMAADQELLIICKSGGRSARVMDYLADQGFSNVYNVIGGMDAWTKG
ncbi:MAG: rhodanese-like domain-containing protein, partial [Akkermansiaceae bacterium]